MLIVTVFYENYAKNPKSFALFHAFALGAEADDLC